MYAVTGITGKVGGAVARTLLEAGLPVRAIVRDEEKGKPWAALGAARMEPVPRDTWEARFRAEGMKHPLPRIRMVDGFNEGWVDFEGRDAEHHKGTTTLEQAISTLVKGIQQ